MAQPKSHVSEEGIYTQNQQGHHGIKGANEGKKQGHKSIGHANTLSFLSRLGRGEIANHGRPASEGKKGTKNSSYCAKMVNSNKLDFIDTIEQMQLKTKTDVVLWKDAAYKTWSKEKVDAEYPTPDHKDQMCKILKRWWRDREEIKTACLCSLGDKNNFRKGGKKPSNPYESIIAQQLRKMYNNRIKIGPHLISHVAANISVAKGMRLKVDTKKDNDIIQMINEEMFNDLNDLVSRSNIDNPNGPIFHITPNWRHKFTRRENFKWKQEHKTETDLFSLLINLEPSLEYVWLMRLIYDIPAGQGRILNADQTMYYRIYQRKYSYVPE
eukprot:502550_1